MTLGSVKVIRTVTLIRSNAKPIVQTRLVAHRVLASVAGPSALGAETHVRGHTTTSILASFPAHSVTAVGAYPSFVTLALILSDANSVRTWRVAQGRLAGRSGEAVLAQAQVGTGTRSTVLATIRTHRDGTKWSGPTRITKTLVRRGALSMFTWIFASELGTIHTEPSVHTRTQVVVNTLSSILTCSVTLGCRRLQFSYSLLDTVCCLVWTPQDVAGLLQPLF